MKFGLSSRHQVLSLLLSLPLSNLAFGYLSSSPEPKSLPCKLAQHLTSRTWILSSVLYRERNSDLEESTEAGALL